jgi:hypothetical protein
MFLLILATLVLCCAPRTSTAQDTAVAKLLQFSLVAEHLYQGNFTNREVMAHPSYTERNRWDDWPNGYPVTSTSHTVTDNPLLHGASYAKLTADVRPLDAVYLRVEAIAEHRGISYGVYEAGSLLFIPRITLSFDTSIRLGPERVAMRLSVGNFTNLKLQEGLTVYNIDAQGTDAEIQWRRLVLRAHNIGDLLYGIGLGINDLRTYMIELRDVPLVGPAQVDASLAFQPVGDWDQEMLVTQALGVQVDSTRAYVSGSMRNDRRPSYAFLGGVTTAVHTSWMDGSLRAEYRYYQKNYNSGFSSYVNYRGDNYSSHLYPLELFHRPYSQWAVYTELGSDVSSLNLLANVRVPVIYGIQLVGLVDLNTFWAGSYDAYLLPFFDVGLSWQPIEASFVTASVTNRVMNLDRNYPTISALKGVAGQITMRISI